MNNRAIARVGVLFAALFAILFVRQAYVQLISGPSIAARPYNPRHALLTVHRGRILAADGTVLAETVHNRRVYPFGGALAQTVGYLSARYGTAGLENAYDRALSPPDATGEPAAQLAEILDALRAKHSPIRGADIITTLNPAIESTVAAELAPYARAAAVVLDPRSGALLAVASLPSFDPNRLDSEFNSLLRNPASPLLNRALDGLYPPGSTFKIVTAADALDSGVVTAQSTFRDPGYLVVGNFTLHNDEDEYTGTQDVTTAFALSSNVDFAQIALLLGVDRWYSYASAWGLGSSLDFQLPTQRDRIPEKSTVSDGELAQMGFGQGSLLMTPLRMALIASTIANNGVEPRPFVVRQVDRSFARSSYAGASLATPITADTAAEVKKMMVAVVQRGTGTIAALPGITVAGKTGTATNPMGRAHSWFVCFAPAEHPRVAIAVIVENAGYGAAVAAPIARNILRVALKNTAT
ncbi:MAG: penicillin-binding transpeptidase domain-containing protein [Candidatus Eremiobacteraeota bacterium]|nr:penicillin-binding transpeptidase domain-containing protein [Candidatus Eremiobacteraeota bacterium]